MSKADLDETPRRLTDAQLTYLETVVDRSRERRKTWFGERKTTAAMAAEMVLIAYAPQLIAELKLR